LRQPCRRGLPGWMGDGAPVPVFDAIRAEAARRLLGGWHEQRLARMVSDVERQLPLGGYPRASSLLAEGCRLFAADREVGPHIAARMLVDVLPLGGFDDDALDQLAA